MIGTIVNTGTILAGSVLGSIVKKGIKEEYQGALFSLEMSKEQLVNRLFSLEAQVDSQSL